MNVKKVIVDEIPKTCGSCDLFLTEVELPGAWGIDLCVFSPDLKYNYDKDIKKGKRPNWCPLELESEE